MGHANQSHAEGRVTTQQKLNGLINDFYKFVEAIYEAKKQLISNDCRKFNIACVWDLTLLLALLKIFSKGLQRSS